MARNRRQRRQRRSRPQIEIDRGLAWYAVWCAPRAERCAQDDLTRAGFTSYLPTQTINIKRRGRIVEIERLPVSRYLFVGLTAGAPEYEACETALGWHPSAWVQAERPRGRLLHVNHGPLRIPTDALQDFADRCAQGAVPGFAGGNFAFAAGMTARIASGPFQGLAMAVSDLVCDDRVRGLVDLLAGGRVAIEIGVDQLEAA